MIHAIVVKWVEIAQLPKSVVSLPLAENFLPKLQTQVIIILTSNTTLAL